MDAQVAAVNAHMATENYSAISDSDVAKLTAICNTAWTKDVIDAYKASLPKVEDEPAQV